MNKIKTITLLLLYSITLHAQIHKEVGLIDTFLCVSNPDAEITINNIVAANPPLDTIQYVWQCLPCNNNCDNINAFMDWEVIDGANLEDLTIVPNELGSSLNYGIRRNVVISPGSYYVNPDHSHLKLNCRLTSTKQIDKNEIHLFPNPATGQIVVSHEGKIFNYQGEYLMSVEAGKNTINQKGVFFYQPSKSKKIIKFLSI